MQPNFWAGQFLIVSRISYLLGSPERGDIVVFDPPGDDGTADDPADKRALRGAFNQLRKLKTLHPQLKVLMSIGGASPVNSKGFSLAARTKAARDGLVIADDLYAQIQALTK